MARNPLGVSFGVVALLVLTGYPVRAQNKCAGAKIKAAGKEAKCLITLDAKEAKTAIAPPAEKVQKCKDKLSGTFIKNEEKSGCLTTDDAGSIQAKIDAFVLDVDDRLTGLMPLMNSCQSAKLKAVGKKAACLLGLEAKEASKGTLPDPDKVAKCKSKLSTTFSKAEAKGGCASTGDVTDLEDTVDLFVEDVDAELSATATSTTIVTSTTTTTVTLPPLGPDYVGCLCDNINTPTLTVESCRTCATAMAFCNAVCANYGGTAAAPCFAGDAECPIPCDNDVPPTCGGACTPGTVCTDVDGTCLCKAP